VTIRAEALHRRPVRADRTSDRRVTLGAIAMALVFLGAALASTILPVSVRLGAWLPLHLALAGGATTAIAGVMPFFSAALAAAPPASAWLRTLSVGLVVAGAWAVAVGVAGHISGLAVGGGSAFVAGILLTGVAAVAPLGQGLGPSRGLVTAGYVAALGSVAVGASLAIVFLAGWTPLVTAWAGARAIHAWLNLVGFVSLVIATTLLHFFPTVVGARIVRRRSATVVVVGIAGGTALVAADGLLGSSALTRLGALMAMAGALGLAGYAWQTWQARARWTSDAGWHRFAMGGLGSAIGWLQVGVGIAAIRALALGADPTAWAFDAVAAPLVVGWVGLAIVASATHLIPAVGPGTPVDHARQRSLLGRAATIRLAVIDAGVVVLAFGLPLRSEPATVVGTALVALGFAATAGLAAAAVGVGLGRRRGSA
jgi:hypothetical protein